MLPVPWREPLVTRVRSQGRQEEVGGTLVLKNEYDLGGCCARKCLCLPKIHMW